jgi:hypothetical protein
MMKRLLVLMLVLGMTSVASAALEIVSLVTDGGVTWDVVNNQLVGSGVGQVPMLVLLDRCPRVQQLTRIRR